MFSDQFLPGVTKTLAGRPFHIDNGPSLEIVYEQGVPCVVHECTKARLALVQRFLSLFACGPGTQGDDAERQVASQFLQQPNLFRRESVGLCGINGKTAEGVGRVRP